MGIGDQLIATGLARGARERGKRIAFGDGQRIIWDINSESIFRGNPNIAAPGSERAGDIEWKRYFKGARGYNRQAPGRWIWNMDWRCVPGEIFLNQSEIAAGKRIGERFILIEPNVPPHKTATHNKQWPIERFQVVADELLGQGLRVVQPIYQNARYRLDHVQKVETKSFRDTLAIMTNAAIYIGPEGGLHHGAAAVGKPAVVLFGGFIPPQVTGYAMHTNLTGGAQACGSLSPCQHCQTALMAITVDHVLDAARAYL